MAKIEGTNELIAKVRSLARKVVERTTVAVGYTQSYAIYVHENLESIHPVGQAKYLEQPLRERERDLRAMIEENLKRRMPLNKAILLAGLLLQRLSQQLVPVDTGALKGSAFTKQEQ